MKSTSALAKDLGSVSRTVRWGILYTTLSSDNLSDLLGHQAQMWYRYKQVKTFTHTQNKINKPIFKKNIRLGKNASTSVAMDSVLGTTQHRCAGVYLNS